MKKLCLIAIILSAAVQINLFSQFQINDDPAITVTDPVSIKDILQKPKVGTLSDAGTANVDLFTGRANYSIPLYTFSSYDLKLPITISYSSAGVPVEKVSEWTGMDWNLTVGGSITREIRGIPDEHPTAGYWTNADDINFFYTDLINGNDDLMTYSAKTELIDNSVEDIFDGEPDIYYFNFGGYSGKFVIDCFKRLHFIPNQHLLITAQWSDDDLFDGFIITTPDGTKYTFGINSDAIEETRISVLSYEAYLANPNNPYTDDDVLRESEIVNDKVEGFPEKETFSYYRSAWHLSEIESPTGDKITFQYKENEITYLSPQRINFSYWLGTRSGEYLQRYGFGWYTECDNGSAFRMDFSDDEDPGWSLAEPLRPVSFATAYTICFSQSKYLIKRKHLSTITAESGNYIIFNSDATRADLPDGLKLNSIDIYNYENTLVKSFDFTYNTVLSDTYSSSEKNPLSIGEFLYFNANTDLPGTVFMDPSDFPDYIESSPCYSTVGSYVGEGLKEYNYKRLFLQSVKESGKPAYLFSYNHPEDLQRRSSVWVDYYGYNIEGVEHEAGSTDTPPISPFNSSSNTYVTLGMPANVESDYDSRDLARQPLDYVSKAGLLSKVVTPLGSAVEFVYEDNIIVNGSDTTRPGSRVCEIIKNEKVGDPSFKTVYSYSTQDNWCSLSTEPVVVYKPFAQEYFYTIDDVYVAFKYKSKHRSSSNLNTLIATKGSLIGYKEVTVTSKNVDETESLGREVYAFSTDGDTDGEVFVSPIYVKWEDDLLKGEEGFISGVDNHPTISYSRTDNSIKRGLLQSRVILNDNNDTISKSEYIYNIKNLEKEQNLSSDDQGIGVSKILVLNCINFNFFRAYGEDVEKRREIVFTEYPDLGVELASEVNTIYGQSDASKHFTVEKVYTYNSLNGLVESETETNSDGTVHSVNNRYYVDYISPGSATYDLDDFFTYTIDAMNSKNIRSAILERTELNNGKIVEKILTEYCSYLGPDGFPNVLPTRIYKINSQYDTGGLDAYISAVSVDGVFGWVLTASENYKLENTILYNVYGQVIQTQNSNNIKTKYCWGYNSQYPIAKIENSGYVAYYKNFEDGSDLYTLDSHTGKSCKRLLKKQDAYADDMIIYTSIIPISGKYVYSGWFKTTGTAYLIVKDDDDDDPYFTTTISNTGGEWKYYELVVDFDSSVFSDCTYIGIEIFNPSDVAVLVDDVSLRPLNSQITTYTYDPLVGMTSQTDANGTITFYEYDETGRLKEVKDSREQIMEKHTYHYRR